MTNEELDKLICDVARPLKMIRGYYDENGVTPNQLYAFARSLLAEVQKLQEPVTWLPSAEWMPCVKLPIVVHVRKQREGETHISTREGITPIKADDLIMRGISGEEYPIGREIFEKTYRIGDSPAPVAPAGWLRAIDEELTSSHLGVANLSDTFEEAQQKLITLTNWHIQVAIDPAVNGGYKLLPIEPTREMLIQICPASADLNEWRVNYKAMLNAAPKGTS